MEKRYKLIVLIFFIFFLLTPSIVYTQETLIGAVLPLSGSLSSVGNMEKMAIEMAVDRVNTSLNDHGKSIKVSFIDSEANPDVAKKRIDHFIQIYNPAVITGGVSSSVVWALGKFLNDKKIPFVVSTASADRITQEGWEYIFRICPSTNEKKSHFVRFLQENHEGERVAIIHEKSTFGYYWMKKALVLFLKMGLRVIANEGFIPGLNDYRDLLLRIKDKAPDMVYLISHLNETSLITIQSKELGLNPPLFIVKDEGGVINPDFFNLTSFSSDLITTFTLWAPCLPYPGAQAFFNSFYDRYAKFPDYHGAQAYSSILVIADAVSRSLEGVKDSMWESLKLTDIMTPYGSIKFKQTEAGAYKNEAHSYAVRWNEGQLHLIWPKVETLLHY